MTKSRLMWLTGRKAAAMKDNEYILMETKGLSRESERVVI